MRTHHGTVVTRIEEIPVGIDLQDSKYWAYFMKQTTLKGFMLNIPEEQDEVGLCDLGPMGIRTRTPPLNIYDLEMMFQKVGGVEGCFSKYQRLGHIFVNGQVKNYLVALVGLAVAPDARAIAILGSRAGEGSGNWIEMFADAMLTRGTDITINCYDPLETGAQKTYSCFGKKVTINRYAQKYLSTGKEFDLVLDDIYTSGGTASVVQKWDSKHWVRKCIAQLSNRLQWSMCFHPTEGREVSNSFELRPNQVTSCQCAICRLCATVSYDHLSHSIDLHAFWKFRSYASVLGAYTCDRSSHMADVLVVSSTVVSISTGQVVVPETKAEQRALEVVTRYHETVQIGAAFRSNRITAETKVKQDYKKMFKKSLVLPLVVETNVIKKNETFSYFSGRSVFFAGVSPSVLGITPIKPRTGSTYSMGGDIIIASGLSALSIVNGPGPEIWMPGGLDLPGYVQSKEYRFKEYFRYDCIHRDMRTVVDVSPTNTDSVKIKGGIDYDTRFNLRNNRYTDKMVYHTKSTEEITSHLKDQLLPRTVKLTARAFCESRGFSLEEIAELVSDGHLPPDYSIDDGFDKPLCTLFWMGLRQGLWVVDRGRFVVDS